jgi:hypothetical protein
VPDVEFSYINFYRRIITNTRNAEKQLEKMTLERNQNEIEEKLATLVQEEFFQNIPSALQSMNFLLILFPLNFSWMSRTFSVQIYYAGHNSLMIRRDGNILEAGKARGIPLEIVENRNSIEEDSLLLPRSLIFLDLSEGWSW